jgi:class 3 adenylate cyclase
VGSEYKIDATYLSPHVNMASRMTSACKQYDLTLMVSQSVQELMSSEAQSKLRHVDTVTVKGKCIQAIDKSMTSLSAH